MRAARRTADPFRPVGWIVQILLGLLGASIALGLAAAVYVASVGPADSSIGVYEFGAGDPCLELDQSDLQLPEPDGSRTAAALAEAPTRVDPDAADVRAAAYRVCLTDASTYDRAVLSAPGFMLLVTSFVALLLVNRVITTGRVDGLFTDVMASRLRVTGWFLLVTAALLPATDVAAEVHVIRSVDPDRTIGPALASPPISILLVLVALGLLAMARIMRRSVDLQAEVDATV